MKKIFLIVILIVLTLTAAVYFWYTGTSKKSIVEVLPQKPVCYIHLRNADKIINHFTSSKLWKNLEGIDIEHLLKESDVPDDVIKEYGKYKDMSEGLPAELLLDDYFGKEILLAVYPPKTTKEQADSWERLKSSVVLVTRIKTGAKVFNFFTGIFKDIGGEIVIESDKFLDHKITTVIVTDEISLFFAEIENLMILALDKNTVQECLKVAKGKKSSLAQEAIYKETMDGLPSGADTYIYADCKGYVDLLSDIMILANSYFINNLDSDKSEFSSVLKQQMGKSIQGFKSFGYASTIGKNSEAKSVVLIDNDKLNTINKIVFAQRPAVSKALKLVPKNCLAFFWFTLNFEQYWQGLKEQIEENQAFTQIGEDVKQDQQKMGIDELVKQFQNKTGIDIENQLFSALGSDAAIIVNDFDAEGSIPLPEITVLCRINDKAEMEKIIKALLKDSKIDLSAKTVKGGKIEYIALPFGTNLQPGYAFFEDYLIISNNYKLIEESMKISTDESKSILANEDLNEMGVNLKSESNSISFIQFDAVLNKVDVLVDKGYDVAKFSSDAIFEGKVSQAEADVEKLRKDMGDIGWEADGLNKKVGSLNKRMDELDNGESASPEQEESAALSKKLKAKNEELKKVKEELKEAEREFAALKGQKKANTEQFRVIKLYIDEAVHPIIDGIKLKAGTLKSVYGEDKAVNYYYLLEQ